MTDPNTATARDHAYDAVEQLWEAFRAFQLAEGHGTVRSFLEQIAGELDDAATQSGASGAAMAALEAAATAIRTVLARPRMPVESPPPVHAPPILERFRLELMRRADWSQKEDSPRAAAILSLVSAAMHAALYPEMNVEPIEKWEPPPPSPAGPREYRHHLRRGDRFYWTPRSFSSSSSPPKRTTLTVLDANTEDEDGTGQRYSIGQMYPDEFVELAPANATEQRLKDLEASHAKLNRDTVDAFQELSQRVRDVESQLKLVEDLAKLVERDQRNITANIESQISAIITRIDMLRQVSREAPVHGGDDLERIRCRDAGKVMHEGCGWCVRCGAPRFECLHLAGHTAATGGAG